MKNILKTIVCLAFAVVIATGCGMNNKKNLSSNKVESVSTMKKLPMFEGEDMNGKKVDMSLLKDNKYTLINVWSPGCGACREEIPTLKKLKSEYKDKGINIVGVVYDGNSAKMTAYNLLKDNDVNYENIIPTDKFLNEVISKEKAIPYSILVDSKGSIKKFVMGALPYEGFKTLLETEAK